MRGSLSFILICKEQAEIQDLLQGNGTTCISLSLFSILATISDSLSDSSSPPQTIPFMLLFVWSPLEASIIYSTIRLPRNSRRYLSEYAQSTKLDMHRLSHLLQFYQPELSNSFSIYLPNTVKAYSPELLLFNFTQLRYSSTRENTGPSSIYRERCLQRVTQSPEGPLGRASREVVGSHKMADLNCICKYVPHHRIGQNQTCRAQCKIYNSTLNTLHYKSSIFFVFPYIPLDLF